MDINRLREIWKQLGPTLSGEVHAFVEELFLSVDVMNRNTQAGANVLSQLIGQHLPEMHEYDFVQIGQGALRVLGEVKLSIDWIMSEHRTESDATIIDLVNRLATENKQLREAVTQSAAKINQIVEEGMKGMELAIPDDPDRPHIVKGEFQSDKYPKTPRGKVPLSVKDPLAQDLLWEYAQRRRQIDSDFSNDLEFALRNKGFTPQAPSIEWEVKGAGEERTSKKLFVHSMTAYGTGSYRPFEMADMLKIGWYTAPPWLKDATEALGFPKQALNWNQLLRKIRELRALYEEAMKYSSASAEAPTFGTGDITEGATVTITKLEVKQDPEDDDKTRH